MGEDALQRFIAELLRPLIAMWLAMSDRKCFVGADQFIYLVEGDNKTRVAPDVYVLPGVDPNLAPPCWKLWELESGPSFAVEIASQKYRKDYFDLPPEYDRMGTRELVIFDPKVTSRSRVRVRWQIYRRVSQRGWKLVEKSNEDRVYSRELGCWLRAVGSGPQLRVRLSTGDRGDVLVPTEGETAQAERTVRAMAEAKAAIMGAQAEAERDARQRAEEFARAEAKRAQAEAERAQAEAERAQAEAERAQAEAERAQAAERELARLREEIAKLREGGAS